jgi:toxin YoeB
LTEARQGLFAILEGLEGRLPPGAKIHLFGKTLRRINQLIKDVQRSPFEGIGKPEPLKENLTGFWSRRIDETNRLVYEVDGTQINIISCRYHY